MDAYALLLGHGPTLRPIFGALLAVLLNRGVRRLLVKAIDIPMKRATDDPSKVEGAERGIYVLGVLETLLFFGSIWAGKYELAAGWLVFKVGTKWSAWQHIVGVPKGPEDDSARAWKVRNAWASIVVSRYLVGTAANAVIARSSLLDTCP